MRMSSRRAFGLALAGSFLTACSPRSSADYRPSFSTRPSSTVQEYTFAVHPLHNPELLYSLFAPLMTRLAEHVGGGASFRLVASRDYKAFETRLMAGAFDFALPNPYQTLRALQHGYRVFAKEADDDEFRGLIVVRRDAEIETPEDLVGRTISYPAPTAVAATLMVKFFLQSHGLPIHRTRSIYVGSQESAISSVFLRASDAGGTWTAPWGPFLAANPNLRPALEVRWRTDALVNNGVVARMDVPDAVTGRVRDVLIGLGESASGRELLATMAIPGFEAATARTYEPVRDFIARYEASIGPIDANA